MRDLVVEMAKRLLVDSIFARRFQKRRQFGKERHSWETF